MIKHVVSWKLKEEAGGRSKSENAIILRDLLEALPARIPQIHKLEVGFDFSGQDTSADVILYSEFKTKEDLNAYQVHPAHQGVIPFVQEVICGRTLVDYDDGK